MNINDIPADCQLVKIKIDIASRTINLYGDGGELVQLIEADSDDFTKMCNFVNETLEDHPEKVEYVFWGEIRLLITKKSRKKFWAKMTPSLFL